MDTYITDDELDAIAAARAALQAIERRTNSAEWTGDAHTAGIIMGLSRAADDSVFRVMNYVNAYGGQPISREHMHGVTA